MDDTRPTERAGAANGAGAGDEPPHGEAGGERFTRGGAGIRADELLALLGLLDGARAALPRELEERLRTLLRELLLTLRALIDWNLERLERGRAAPPVEDIPIE